MLFRISCDRCCLSSLWTDDPRWFLDTVCNGGTRCEATLVTERFAGVVISRLEDVPTAVGPATGGIDEPADPAIVR